MNNLTRFDSEGIEIFINEAGESFSSIRGVARMAGTDPKTIRQYIRTEGEITVIKAKVPTATGLKTGDMLPESSICKILAKYNPGRLEQFAMLGIRTALHQIAGYKQQPVKQKLEPIDIFNLDERTTQLLYAWELYGRKENAVEIWDKMFWTFPHPDEFASLDDRLKKMPMAAIRHVFHKQILATAPRLQEYVDRFVPDPCDIKDAAAAQEFQSQLNAQLAPAASQQQLGGADA
jgi:hypothetical protein